MASALSGSVQTTPCGCGSPQRVETSRLWDDTGTVWARLGFSPDGRFIVTSCDDGTARDPGRHGRCGSRAPGAHRGDPVHGFFRGRRADRHRLVRRYRPHMECDAHSVPCWLQKQIEPPKAAAFSTGGRRLVTASSDTIVRVWDMASDAPPIELPGHEGPGEAVAISSDETRVYRERHGTGVARLWDVASRAPPVALGRLPAGAVFVGFSRDGRRMVARDAPRGADVERRRWQAGQDIRPNSRRSTV